MYTAPCKDCGGRHSLCHAHCKKYLEYKRKYEAEKKLHREEMTIRGVISTLNHDAAFTRKDGSRRREGWKCK